jgi:hypothetical protein
MALFCFGRFPQWVRFFQSVDSGTERCAFIFGGESRREAALTQVSFCKSRRMSWRARLA